MKTRTFTYTLSFVLSLLFSSISVEAEAQFCCCPFCPTDCITDGFGGCGSSCFITNACSNPGGATDTPNADCSGTSCNPLPVKLVYFNAKVVDGGVELTWRTETEIDNEGFEIQRGIGATFEWEYLHFEKGYGTSTEVHEYFYFDDTPPPGDNYYRLKQLDFDGTETYSKTEVASVDLDQKRFSLWPTLADENVLVKVEDHSHSNPIQYQAKVFDMMGREVMTSSFDEGLNLNVSNLTPGQYLINVQSEGFVETLRFVKIQ